MPESLKYSTVDGLDIYIDYVIPSSATKEKPAPIYLWFVRLPLPRHAKAIFQGFVQLNK